VVQFRLAGAVVDLSGVVGCDCGAGHDFGVYGPDQFNRGVGMNRRLLPLSRRRKTSAAAAKAGGTTLIETIVAATLMVTVISFFTTVVFRVDRVWQDTADRRAAMTELSNQLEVLTQLTPDQARQQIDSLQPSAATAMLLDEPVIAAELVEDEWGERVELELNWQRPLAAAPVRLVGWLRPADADTTEQEPTP
jgi:hypothetical protein